MDITRNSHPQPQQLRNNLGSTTAPGNNLRNEKRRPEKRLSDSLIKLTELILLFAATGLIVALSYGIYQGGPSEDKYVDTTKFQAVFLNGGVTNGQILYSTYFGHITALNDRFLVLQDVYYITSSTTGSQASSSSNVQLTKLGCQQLHAPYDMMIINKNQVAFWENLQNSGQVVKAIQNYQKANPNGPNCTQTTNSTTSSPTTTNSSSTSTTP